MADLEQLSLPEVPEAPVAAEPAKDTQQATAAPAEAPIEGDKPAEAAERTFSQKELDEIIQKRLAKESRRAERFAEERVRREMAESELARMREAQNPKPVVPQGEPQPTQFQAYEDYVKALAKWTYTEEQKTVRQHEMAQRAAYEADQRAQYVQSKLAPAAQKYADFVDVALSEDTPIAPPTAEFIVQSEMGGDIAYYLGKHQDEAAKIAAMPPAAQFRALIGIEDRLKATPAPTRAPAPIEPTAGKSTVAKSIYDPDISQEEFEKLRRKQIAARYT